MLPTQVLLVDAGQGALSRLLPALKVQNKGKDYLLVHETQAALELLMHRRINIVVADFGGQTSACSAFFQAVADDKPQTIRISMVPSVASVTEGITTGRAHYLLAADSDARELCHLLERSQALWERMQLTPRLTGILSHLDVIPTPPAMYFDIRDALERESSSMRTIAQLVEKDPALVAKTLKVANSGFYGLPRTVADLAQAIGLIGTDTVMALALSSHLFAHLPLPGVNLDQLWLHGLAVSTLARYVAQQEGGDRSSVNASGVAGLLHDIGGLLLLANFPSPYQRILRQAGGDETVLLQLEQSQFGFGHPELGGLMLSLWNLPDAVVTAVSAHHGSADTGPDLPELVAFAVNIGEALLQDYRVGDPEDAAQSCLGGRAALDQDKVAGWRSACPTLLQACASSG